MSKPIYEAPAAEVVSFENDYVLAALTNDDPDLTVVQRAGSRIEDQLPFVPAV